MKRGSGEIQLEPNSRSFTSAFIQEETSHHYEQ